MNGVMVETDVIVEFLTAGEGQASLLRRLLEATTCYTTFLNAAEIYSTARDDDERRLVERALFGLKILGASGRYAKTIGEVLSSDEFAIGHRSAIVAGMAMESRLPIVTDTYYEKFSRVPAVRVIQAAALRATADGAGLGELLAAVQ